tara:strand:+ start:318 stop:743 length:426 start_codon:yes stop_codon:yes gene_type:complete
MSGVNKVIIMGNLGKDPEVRQTQNGGSVVSLSVATSETWKDKATGERKEKTEWHRIVSFSKGINSFVENYVKKGSKVYVEGKLQTRKWTDKSGVEKYTTEVVIPAYNGDLQLVDKKSGDSFSPPENKTQEITPDLDDEIPF